MGLIILNPKARPSLIASIDLIRGFHSVSKYSNIENEHMNWQPECVLCLNQLMNQTCEFIIAYM